MPNQRLRLTEPSHIWVVGIYSQDDIVGKDVIFWDESVKWTQETLEDVVYLQDILKAQRNAKQLLTKGYRMKIEDIWWGGDCGDVSLDVSLPCMESSLRFMERFGSEVEDKAGKVTPAMLRQWHLRTMSW